MRVVLFGCVEFSAKALSVLCEIPGLDIVGLVTKSKSAFNSDFVDLQPFAAARGIPVQCTATGALSAEQLAWLESVQPDYIFVFGWSHLLKEQEIQAAIHGAIGFHPAELPQNRGRHPLIWTIIHGLEYAGSSFFFLDVEADSGDIISQRRIRLESRETARSLYDKVIATALTQIREFVPQLMAGTVERVPQSTALATTWRKRSKTDGEIHWSSSTLEVDRLVRALGKPYPGATALWQGQEIVVWSGAPESYDQDFSLFNNGEIIDINEKGAPLVRCGDGCFRITEWESPGAAALKKGQRFT